jgi:hypothetical protein
MRDIHADYRAAYIEEYEALLRTGRKEDAERVAEVLRAHYGHDVSAPADEPTPEGDAPERADSEPLAENTAEPQPKRRTPPAKKAAAKPAGE